LKTLVTGATGFVGRHLIDRLVKEGRSVVCLVREKSDIRSLEKLGVELVYGDLTDKDSLRGIAGDIGTVYHLAGAVYASNNKEFYEVNANGTRNLLQCCAQNGLKKFMYLSSIAVNGLSKKEDVINEASPCIPFTHYGKSKLGAEKLIVDFCNNSDASVIIIRTPVVYGPDGQADLLTNHFKSVLRGKTYIVGNGENLRSLCYIDNLVDGLLLAESGAKSKSAVYVVADDRAYSFIEIVDAIADVYNVKLSKLYLPSFIASAARNILSVYGILGFYSWGLYSLATMNVNMGCDIEKAKNELGYKAETKLKNGLKKTLDYYQKQTG
jgi:nucleoside-diphosphate-sugar epimerase